MDESPVLRALLPNSAYAQLWRVVIWIFLLTGVLVLGTQLWKIFADLHARSTWPSAKGEILSAEIKDDKSMPGKIGSDKMHTNYWVEYNVMFAPQLGCNTGIIYSGPFESMPCRGTVKTRSTRSPREAWEWLNDGYRLNAPITVLYSPEGPQIKIEGESVWLRYHFGDLVLAFVWVFAFLVLRGLVERRLEYFKLHPEAEAAPTE